MRTIRYKYVWKKWGYKWLRHDLKQQRLIIKYLKPKAPYKMNKRKGRR